MLHSYNPPARFLPYLSWSQIAALPDKANIPIVLPAGSVEQHGPHLPCLVDSIIAAGVMGHALARLPAEVPAFALPPITYGKSDEHLHFPGTVTLEGTTLLATVTEIGESVYRMGFRKLLIVNAHGGQPQVMEMAARELRLRHGDYQVLPHFVWRVPHVAGQFMTDREKRLSMHAGHAETAILMALAPETVHMEHAVANYPPEFPSKVLSADGRPAAAWTARDFGPSGIIGDPLPATPAQGQAILDSLADSWAQGLRDLHAMQWVTRDEPSWGRSHQNGHIEGT
ncbi:creatininase family protein [Rubrivivax sp. RP6-9]|uniref:creatininase family protein n=1 Tax=Rubrivivax sp. RP6-9 TaxID=3415750 RepID=UPI003CC686DC